MSPSLEIDPDILLAEAAHRDAQKFEHYFVSGPILEALALLGWQRDDISAIELAQPIQRAPTHSRRIGNSACPFS
jgi:hypothetical protein